MTHIKKINTSLLAILILAAFLRFYNLNSSPPSLYSDEISLGYNAYSLLKTGKDEFGNFLPLSLRSFGDYKPALSAYAMIPSIAMFGLNEFAVRFPFAFFGTLTVLLIYLITKELFSDRKLALLASLLLSLSPWHIQQSRSAMLVGLEIFFVSLGILLFRRGLNKKPLFFLFVLPFSLAFYTYYGSRITIPLLVLLLIFTHFKKLVTQKKLVFKTFLFGLLLLTPLIYATFQNPKTISGRTGTISIFYQQGVKLKLWEDSRMDGNQNPLLTRTFHNKVFYYFLDITERYFQHFNPRFLFFEGSKVSPFEIPNMGIFYLIDGLFLVLGFFCLVSKSKKESWFLVGWLLISPIVASLTFMTPASNRSFNMVIPAQIIIALGIISFLRKIKSSSKRKLTVSIVVIIYFISFLFFQYNFHVQIPQLSPHQWFYGKKQIIKELEKIEKDYQKIVFIKGGPYYIYLLFYKKVDPTLFAQNFRRSPYVDELGWENVESFQKYEFLFDGSWDKVKKEKNVLYISLASDFPSEMPFIKEILFPNGQAAYRLAEEAKLYE
jgi:hypothetical protein